MLKNKTMQKFITPVSMQVTQEQYERDLREPLEKMGYSFRTYSGWSVCPYFITKKDGIMMPNQNHGERAYPITSYNPPNFQS